MADAPDPEQLAARYEQLQRQLQSLDQHLLDLESALSEVEQAAATIAGLEGDGTLDALVPVGGGVQVPARIEAGTHVIVSLGAGYAADMPPDKARERLQARRESLQAALRSSSQEAERVAQAMESLRQQVMSLSPDPATS